MSDPREIAEEQSKPGKFSLLERLRGRNMPTEKMVIYLDEAGAWDRIRLAERMAEETDGDVLSKLEDEYEALTAQVKASAVTLTLRGMTNDEYDDIVAQAKKTYPVKYEKDINILTGENSIIEVPNEARENLINDLFLGATIVKAEFDGATDEDIDAEWYHEFKGLAPLDALRRVAETAYRMRMASQWMDEIQNADF